MELDALLIIGAMTWTAVSLLKHLTNKQYADAVTLLVIVAVGIGAAFLTQGAGLFLVGANVAKTVVGGYAATSIIRGVYEIKKALDSNDSAKEAKLIPPAS